MSAVGALKSSELTTVQAGIQLSKSTAARFKLLKTAAKKQLGRSISIAQPAGGYRSAAVQNAMHHAGSSAGSKAERARWGLNPASIVAIASHPYGTHESGTRVDIVGTAMDARFIALAATFGFVREFGSADPNHFLDKGTYKLTVAKKVTASVVSKKVTVKIVGGDTLSKIAAAHHTTVAKILSLNPSIKSANAIYVGQTVRVA